MDVELTDVGKHWLQGIPYQIPPKVDSQPTIKRASLNR